MKGTGANGGSGDATVDLRFENTGGEVVMLRPRRDLEILAPADSFGANLARGVVQMLVVTALLAAFGLFLSSALSRPVALFTAFVAVAVALMAPSVVLQFPDELETTLSNRVGLAVARAVHLLSATADEATPVSDLATGVCIEGRALFRGVLVNAILLPAGLLGLAALLVRRRPLANQS